jgi:hypothetical protein
MTPMTDVADCPRCAAALPPGRLYCGCGWNHRLDECRRLRAEGWSYERIGRLFGIGRERVRQILKQQQ